MLQKTLKELFPSWEALRDRYREVVLFVVGLMKDPRPLVQYVYEMQLEHYLDEMRSGGDDGLPSIDADLLKSLHAASTVRLFDDPLHNKYINYHGFDGYDDSTPVYFPSRLYQFWDMGREVELENHHTQGEEIPPCAMNIEQPDEAASDSLLLICREISTHQGASDLYMVNGTYYSLDIPKLTNLRSLYLYMCSFPDSFLENLLRQLFDCGDSLQKLEVWRIDLRPYERLVDELLEDLVAHHEAGLAQRKLHLELVGFVADPTNFSWKFKEKWMNRCQRIHSIDCDID